MSFQSPCDTCPGGVTNSCVFASGATSAPWVMVITDTPLDIRPSLKESWQNILVKNGVPADRIQWTSLRKCPDKKGVKPQSKHYDNTAKHCGAWLDWQIGESRPYMVLTIGAEAVSYLTGTTSPVLDIGTIRTLTSDWNRHTYFTLHLQDHRSLQVLPEQTFFQAIAVSRIGKVLAGELPVLNKLADKNYTYIDNPAELMAWLEAEAGTAQTHPLVAYDIEAAGEDEWADEESASVAVDRWNPESFMIGFGLCFEPKKAVWYDVERGGVEGLQIATQFIQDRKLVAHNAEYDLNYTKYKHGIDLWHLLHADTMLMDHTLREWDRKRSLKRLADLLLPEYMDYEEPLHRWFKENGIPDSQKTFDKAPRDMLATYGSMDVDVTFQLYYILERALKNANLYDFYFGNVRNQDWVYSAVFTNGFGLNEHQWAENKAYCLKKKQEAEDTLRKRSEWKAWSLYEEARLRAEGKAFYDPHSEAVYTSSDMFETMPDVVDAVDRTGAPLLTEKGNQKRIQYLHKPGSKNYEKGLRAVKSNVYTLEDLTPDPTNDRFLREFLYSPHLLNLPAQRFTDKAKEPSTAEIALLELEHLLKKKHEKTGVMDDRTEVLSAVRSLGQQQKYLSSFIDPVFTGYKYKTDGSRELRRGWVRADGLIHPGFYLGGAEHDEGGTSSGRVSSRWPNIQQIPSRGKDAKRIKSMIIPVPRTWDGALAPHDKEPWYMLQLDYSQLELRILGDVANEPFITEAYANDEDLHTKLASMRFNQTVEWFEERLNNPDHPEHQKAKDWRTCAKTSWFAFIYGAGAAKLVDTLAKQGVWIEQKDMQEIINGLQRDLPYVEQLRRQVHSKLPVIYNRHGRRRSLHNVKSVDDNIREKAKRQAFNFLIQSEGSDSNSAGLAKAYRWLYEEKQKLQLRAYGMGAVHDSNLVAVPASELDYVAANFKHCMETPDLTFQMNVRLKVDVEYGPNWGNMKNWTGAAA